MPLVVLQPSASESSRKHFEDTIEQPVVLADVAAYLDESDLLALSNAHPSGFLSMWGATPGERGQHVEKWARIQAGDYILFAAQGRLFASAVISYTMRNAALAELLWGTTESANGSPQTWELMFSIDDIQEIDLAYPVLNALVGRSPKAVVQEFNVLPIGPSEALLEYLNRSTNEHEPLPGAQEYEQKVLSEAFGELERQVVKLQRLEQRFLRAALMPGKVSTCALCGREFPTRHMTAAHIKRRSACTDAERRQFSAVAMPNCRFGCDELFGAGMVSVDDGGSIRLSSLLADGPARDYAETHLFGRKCLAWNPQSRPFFAFHFSTDFLVPVTTEAMTA